MKKQTNFEMMRGRLLLRAGVTPPPAAKFNPSDFASLQNSEWSVEFERLMRNRLIMGALRYGTFAEKGEDAKKGKHWDLQTPIVAKLKKYEETGNTEYFVDIANYCMLAFLFDNHPNKHFSALDDHHDHCKRKGDITK